MNQAMNLVGNLTKDAELRYTQNGLAVTNNTIAVTPRFRDKESGEWKDGEATFFDFALWGKDAENFAASASKGQRVLAQGKIKQDSYEKDGVTHKTFKFEVEDIGFSTKYATVAVTRNEKGGQSAQPAAQAAPAAAAPAQAPAPAAAPVQAAPAAAPAAAVATAYAGDDDFS